MKEPIIYTLALTAATLTPYPVIASDSSISDICVNVPTESMPPSKSMTSNQRADDRRYLNSILIKDSFRARLKERKLCENLSDSVKNALNTISEKCSFFDIKEVYADYSPLSNAIRIDMIVDNDFLLIVRKTIEEDTDDNCIAVSLSKGNENYLADYLDLNDFIKDVNYCIKG